MICNVNSIVCVVLFRLLGKDGCGAKLPRNGAYTTFKPRPFNSAPACCLEMMAPLNLDASASFSDPILRRDRPSPARLGADLFYANDNRFTDEVHALVERAPKPVRWFIIDAGAIADLDYSAAQSIRELLDDLGRQRVGMIFARVSSYLRSNMDGHGITAAIGACPFPPGDSARRTRSGAVSAAENDTQRWGDVADGLTGAAGRRSLSDAVPRCSVIGRQALDPNHVNGLVGRTSHRFAADIDVIGETFSAEAVDFADAIRQACPPRVRIKDDSDLLAFAQPFGCALLKLGLLPGLACGPGVDRFPWSWVAPAPGT